MTTEHPIGMLIIDKPLDMTSMHVCRVIKAKLRKGGASKRVKVGHGGTLDPLATGVLVVLIGRQATKLSNTVMEGTKVYHTTVDLSCTSSTDDAEGERTPVDVDQPPDHSAVEAACKAWTGTVMQTPPMYSAIKVGGQRAYRLARAEQDVQLEARPIRIDAIDVRSYVWPILELDITCGKGTYIRSLGRDIGARLGVGGMLTSLRRTRVGACTIEQARSLDALPDVLTSADLLDAQEALGSPQAPR